MIKAIYQKGGRIHCWHLSEALRKVKTIHSKQNIPNSVLMLFSKEGQTTLTPKIVSQLPHTRACRDAQDLFLGDRRNQLLRMLKGNEGHVQAKLHPLMCVELDSEAETPIFPTCKSSFVDSHADYHVFFPISVIHSLLMREETSSESILFHLTAVCILPIIISRSRGNKNKSTLRL